MTTYDKPLPNGFQWNYDKKSKCYIGDVACSLDTETTNYIIDEEHRYSWIYIFQMMIKDTFITCRTYDELQTVFTTISNKYGLNEKRRLIIYVHNLPFEFQFLRTRFFFDECLAKTQRRVFKVFFKGGFEFRDSLILSGMSLAKTAENLTEHTIRKLKGDLDYSLIRTPETPITPQEMQYCYNDVKIICDYIDEQRHIYGNVSQIPLTNTGRVRNFVRKACFKPVINPKTHKKHIPYKNLMERLTLDVTEYAYAKMSFLGGYTHANARYVGQKLSDVHSIDFTSSYPTVMIAEKYPMSKGTFIELNMHDYDTFKTFLGERVAFVMVEFKNIITKSTIPDDYISYSRTFDVSGAVQNNGRIHEADYVKLIVTSVDLEQIVSAYNYSEINIIDGWFYFVDYLPKPIIECVLELYQKKTTLKGVKGKETEYLLSKGMLNSCYGMCVTDIVGDEEICTFENGWSTEKGSVDECIAEYNNNPNRFLSYLWGVFVTAYARRNLFNGIKTIGMDYVYCDTDSIKFFNKPKHDAYIQSYNQIIVQKCEQCLKHYDIDVSELSPVTIKGVHKPLGVWDYEGKYTYFKTLGCKRYLTYTDELDLTCAGLPNSNGVQALTSDGCSVDEAFNRFNRNFAVDAEHSGKLAHQYQDKHVQLDVVDYNGKHATIDCTSSCVLFPIPFTVNFSSDFAMYLKYKMGVVI